MTKYGKVLINEVTGEGFKGFQERRVFTMEEGMNTFIGENGNGKSSIGDLIIWIIKGANISGKQKDINILNKDSKVAIGTLSFTDEIGEVHVIERKFSSSTTIKFDNKRIPQKKLDELIDTELFLLMFNPMYFLSLDAENSRKTLSSLLPEITKEDVLKELNTTEKEFLEKEHFEINLTNEYLKNRRSELSEIEDNKKFAEGYMAKLGEAIQIPEAVTFDNSKIEKLEKELELLGQRKPTLINLSELLMKKSEFDKQIALISNERFENQHVKMNLENRKALLEQQIKMEIAKEYKAVDSSNLESRVKVLRSNYSLGLMQSKELEAQMQAVANKRTHFHEGDECPSCKQIITAKAVEALNGELQKQAQAENSQLQVKHNGIKKSLAELENEGKELVALITKAREDDDAKRKQFESQKQMVIQKLENELNDICKQLNNLKAVQDEFEFKKQQRINAVKKQIEDLQLSNLEKENAQIQKAFDESIRQERYVLQQNLTALRKQREEVLEAETRRQALLKQAEKNKAELDKKKAEFQALEKKETHIENQISFMKIFNSQKSAIMNRMLSKHLSDISIKLEKAVVTTGEIKECFEILFRGKELNVCSTSETIKAGLEISQMIRELSGLNYPVFVDNGESITNYVSTATQTIETKVVKNSKLSVVKDGKAQEIGVTPKPKPSKTKTTQPVEILETA